MITRRMSAPYWRQPGLLQPSPAEVEDVRLAGGQLQADGRYIFPLADPGQRGHSESTSITQASMAPAKITTDPIAMALPKPEAALPGAA